MRFGLPILGFLLGGTVLLACRGEPGDQGLDPEPNPVVALRIRPDTAALPPGDTLRLTVLAVRQRGDSAPAVGVTFGATGGSIDQQGLFRAGLTPGRFGVTATARASGGSLDATATVVVLTPPPPPPPPPPPAPPPIVAVLLTPDSVSVPTGGQRQFAAVGRRADSVQVALPDGVFEATGGQVSASGGVMSGGRRGRSECGFRCSPTHHTITNLI